MIPEKMKTGAVFFTIISLLTLTEVPSGAEYKRETAVVQAVRKISPAVVNISSEYEIRQRTNPFSGFGMDPFFDSFFKDFFEPGYEQRYKRSSLGSGVIIDGKRGFILTNSHVIEKTGKITVALKDEREFEAQVVGADPDSDLAVLRIESATALPAIDMGNSDDLMIGETVIAIGNPFGFSNTVTTGVISALNRSIRTEERVFLDFIQTDASINPGNSGGPLLNINGELIGINTAIYAKAQGIGFAIPINKARRIVADLIRYGEVVPAWVGIVVQNLDKKLAQYLKLPSVKGVLVKDVERKSPAIAAGIREGDIIVDVGGRSIQSVQDYDLALKNYAAEDTIKLGLLRSEKKLSVAVRTKIFPQALAKEMIDRLLGIKVNSAGAGKGVVITDIRRNTHLAGIGAKPGDIIRQVDDVAISTEDDFEKAVIKYRSKSSVVLLLQRGYQLYYITVKLG